MKYLLGIFLVDYVYALDGNWPKTNNGLLSKRSEALEEEARANAAMNDGQNHHNFLTNPLTKRRSLEEIQNCKEELYIIEANDNTRYGEHEGSYSQPVIIEAGCPIQVEMAPGKNFYMDLSGFRSRNTNGNRPQLYYSWSVDIDYEETPLTLFSFRDQPTNQEIDLGTDYDWYYWPILADDAITFREDTTNDNIDYYHCYQFCGYSLEASCAYCGNLDLRSRYDTLHISISTFPEATETMRLTLMFDLVYNNEFILPEELQVIRDLFIQLCLPYNNIPADWSWESHQQLATDEIQGEYDSRRKPYCDWLPTVELEEIEALTENDCLYIPGITCSEDGHISDIILPEMGLRGELPQSIATLTHLVYFEMPNNRISGNLPQHFFASTSLKKINLNNNFLQGMIPCPDQPVLNLKSIHLSNNMLNGDLTCLFANLPQVQTINLAQNNFDAQLPAEISIAQNLAELYLERSGIHGTLDHLTQLPLLTTVDLSHNFLTGSLSAQIFNALPRLYRLDLSWNDLSGSLPSFAEADNLRRVDLSHNKFSGEMNQFTEFAKQQSANVGSSLDLSSNFFCGQLPELFYDIIMDANYHLAFFDVSGNHFRCSMESNNQYFAPWATALRHDFGKCITVPEIESLDTQIIVFDPTTLNIIYVNGVFTPTTDGSCKFDFADGTNQIVPAIFESSTRVACTLPDNAPIGQTFVTIASYCDDYASTETVQDFIPMSFEIIQQTPSPTIAPASNSNKSKTDQGALIGGTVAAIVAIMLLCCVCFILSREHQGKPILNPGKSTLNPITSIPMSNVSYDDGIDMEIMDDESKKQHDDNML